MNQQKEIFQLCQDIQRGKLDSIKNQIQRNSQLKACLQNTSIWPEFFWTWTLGSKPPPILRPLHLAASLGKVDIVQYLLSIGADVNSVVNIKLTIKSNDPNASSGFDDKAMLAKLDQLYAEFQAGSSSSKSFQNLPPPVSPSRRSAPYKMLSEIPLLTAIRAQQVDIVAILLQKGANTEFYGSWIQQDGSVFHGYAREYVMQFWREPEQKHVMKMLSMTLYNKDVKDIGKRISAKAEYEDIVKGAKTIQGEMNSETNRWKKRQANLKKQIQDLNRTMQKENKEHLEKIRKMKEDDRYYLPTHVRMIEKEIKEINSILKAIDINKEPKTNNEPKSKPNNEPKSKPNNEPKSKPKSKPKKEPKATSEPEECSNTEPEPEECSYNTMETTTTSEDHEDLLCVTCLVLPKECQIFGCQNCDAMICEGCAVDINHCPVCREDLDVNGLVRNRFAEKMIAKMN